MSASLTSAPQGAQLTGLRIAGFKSFPEAVSLDILPGLTGIVGPNGCGKSNVVEALRWAMGETSARSLRGGEMDDVIFAGTTARASRNLAEVTITLRGTRQGALPPPFEAEAELAVTRRIERGAGSQFRANGRELRARDVQTLYADLASGARASGMVSQGRVSALVNARPEERRQVLEEAAGITGLHARRHEAELKLRAAEQNALRAEDVLAQLDGTREGLRKQARQAARYRTISGLIRTAEREHLAVLLAGARARLDDARETHEATGRDVEEAAVEAGTVADALADAETALPAPREALDGTARALERRRIEAEGLAAEADRVTRDAAAAAQRASELQADCAAAERTRSDTDAAVGRLEAEIGRLAALVIGLPVGIAAAEAGKQAAAVAEEVSRRTAADAARTALDARLYAAEAGARRAALAERAGALRDQLAAALADQVQARTKLVLPARITEATAAQVAAEAGLGTARCALAAAEQARVLNGAALFEARGVAEQAQTARLQAEQAHTAATAQVSRLAQALAVARDRLRALMDARVNEGDLGDGRAGVQAAEQAVADSLLRLETAETAMAATRTCAADAAQVDAALRAARSRAREALEEAQARARRMAADHGAARMALAEAGRAGPDATMLDQAAQQLAGCERAVAVTAEAWRGSQTQVRLAEATLTASRAAFDAANSARARLAGEVAGLDALDGETDADDGGVLAAIEVPEALEAALGVALGTAGLAASLAAAPLEAASPGAAFGRFWRAPERWTAPHLPTGSVALGTLVQAPAELACALAHVALLDDAAYGDAVRAGLAPGVTAVDRAGGCWRWDGLVTRAGTPNGAGLRLQQRRRLSEARAASAAAEMATAIASEALALALEDARTAQAGESAACLVVAETEAAFRKAGEVGDRLAAQAAHAGARRAALLASVERMQTELDGAAALVLATSLTLHGLEDGGRAATAARDAAVQVGAASTVLAGAQSGQQAARRAHAAAREAADRLERRAAEIQARIGVSAPALDHLTAEHAAASAHLAETVEMLGALPHPATAAAALRSAEMDAVTAQATETRAREARRVAEFTLDGAREALATLQAGEAAAAGEFLARDSLLGRVQADAGRVDALLAEADARAACLPDGTALAAVADAARAAREDAWAALQSACSRLDALQTSLAQAETGLAAARTDLAAWQARHADASARTASLAGRVQVAHAAWDALAASPASVAAQAEGSAAALADAEAHHRAAQSRLDAASQRVRALMLVQRDAEQVLSARREAKVRAEAAHEAAGGAVQAVLARAAASLGEAGEEEETSLPAGDDLSDAAEERARRQLERLSREREEIGLVNLRAEIELAELDERVADLERERGELATAIAKLRGHIGHLNREGRTRLAAVFDQVDQHFRTLFTRMMGGGRAHLAWSGSEDPLLAGLEIYAEPPGKKLASLSLLSGGEQALTALSLIFAVFRCTPAPIAVLDEVDAPLDDANVERFCTLLDDVVRDTGTRFLVVTHHQVTMSRMDRLFGVTMQERGVSRLLSVDLRSAAAMVEPVTALQAAE